MQHARIHSSEFLTPSYLISAYCQLSVSTSFDRSESNVVRRRHGNIPIVHATFLANKKKKNAITVRRRLLVKSGKLGPRSAVGRYGRFVSISVAMGAPPCYCFTVTSLHEHGFVILLPCPLCKQGIWSGSVNATFLTAARRLQQYESRLRLFSCFFLSYLSSKRRRKSFSTTEVVSSDRKP